MPVPAAQARRPRRRRHHGGGSIPAAHRKGRLSLAARLTAAAALATALALGVYASSFVVDYGAPLRSDDSLLLSDVSRLSREHVARIEVVHDVAQLRQILRDARGHGLTVSIAGRRHSQGGHTFHAGGVVLDMRGFNRVLAIDTARPAVTVESGATWDDVQRALAPRGLAVKVMQSANIFTVGGTLSANAHGRDLEATQVVEVVERFRLMLADGRVVEVSRDENPELFSLAIGGYGLFGVILDVTLRVTRDELYQPSAVAMDYTEFPRFFAARIAPDPAVALMIARPSIDPRPERFLRETVVATWRRGPPDRAGSFALTEEAHVLRDRFFFGLSRRFAWAKSLRWSLQKRLEPVLTDAAPVSRNNAMRPPVVPTAFLQYRSRRNTDILQEYFVPTDAFVPFMDRLRGILTDGDVNLLSVTVRYVKPNATPVLAYAPTEAAFAVVLLYNVGLSAEAQAEAEAVTRRLVDAALEAGGTYYLTYQLYPTTEQLRRAYPGAVHAFERKRFYDPDQMFSSQFYERYGRDPS